MILSVDMRYLKMAVLRRRRILRVLRRLLTRDVLLRSDAADLRAEPSRPPNALPVLILLQLLVLLIGERG